MCSCPRTSRSILHADLDAFFASVEQRYDPRPARQAVAVGGGSCSPRATRPRRSASLGDERRQARAVCPGLIVAPTPHADAYSEASRAVFAVFEDTTPLVEALSIDEAFLDVCGRRGSRARPRRSPGACARTGARAVGLPITVGVAGTKFLAKVASGVAKPDGLFAVEPDGELHFLHPLPVERLWGVGRDGGKRATASAPSARSRPRRDAARRDARQASGRHLHSLAHNLDPRPVRAAPPAFDRLPTCARPAARARSRELDGITAELVDRATRPHASAHRAGRAVLLRLRFDDFTRVTRSHTLPQATARTEPILGTMRRPPARPARPIIDQRGITLVGMSVGNLDDGIHPNSSLPLDKRVGSTLDAALDDVRDRFGTAAVTCGIAARP